MKKIMMLILMSVCISCCEEKDTSNEGKAECGLDSLFVKNSHLDLGKISKSDRDSVFFAFDLKNCGTNVVVINKIDVSCNCVSLAKPTRPIRPNEWSRIFGRIRINNQIGHLSKSIFVNYGNDKLLLLRVKAEIHD